MYIVAHSEADGLIAVPPNLVSEAIVAGGRAEGSVLVQIAHGDEAVWVEDTSYPLDLRRAEPIMALTEGELDHVPLLTMP